MNLIIDLVKGFFITMADAWKSGEYVLFSLQIIILLAIIGLTIFIVYLVWRWIINCRDKDGQIVQIATVKVIDRWVEEDQTTMIPVSGMLMVTDSDDEFYITFNINGIECEAQVDEDVYESDTVEVTFIVGKSGTIHIENVDLP